jgi:hypothetical protein
MKSSSIIKSKPTIIEDPNILRQRILNLEEELRSKQEVFLNRERAHLAKIEEYEEEINSYRRAKTGWMSIDSRYSEGYSKIKGYQGEILETVDLIQHHTVDMLEKQEKDLVRAFRARLSDIRSELSREKNKQDEGAEVWAARGVRLDIELSDSKAFSDKIERVNHSLMAENNRLRGELQSIDEDRLYMTKQLSLQTKENGRLQLEHDVAAKKRKALKFELEKVEIQATRHHSMIGATAQNPNKKVDSNSEDRLVDYYLHVV